MAEGMESNRELDIFRKAVTCSTRSKKTQRRDRQILSLALYDEFHDSTTLNIKPFALLKVVIYLKDYLAVVRNDEASIICMRGSGTFNELEFSTFTGFVFGHGSYKPLEQGHGETIPSKFSRTFHIRNAKKETVANITQKAGYRSEYYNITHLDFLQPHLNILEKCLLICKFLMLSLIDPNFSQPRQQQYLRESPSIPEDMKFLEDFDYDTIEFGFIGKKVCGDKKDYYVLYRPLESSVQLIFIYEIDTAGDLTIYNAENLKPVLKVTCARPTADVTPEVLTPSGWKIGGSWRGYWVDRNNVRIGRQFTKGQQFCIILMGSAVYSKCRISACITRHNHKPNFITVAFKIYFEPIRCAMLLANLVRICDQFAKVNQNFNNLQDVQRYIQKLR